MMRHSLQAKPLKTNKKVGHYPPKNMRNATMIMDNISIGGHAPHLRGWASPIELAHYSQTPNSSAMPYKKWLFF
jgi:hypothetical protein